ncbi:hypothetical protein J9303_00330 [Bacillaceae bacterium Marseille-Q3522]|nr:hypothetical protein [Bacillaceae bacterium Marseille-Q3522]
MISDLEEIIRRRVAHGKYDAVKSWEINNPDILGCPNAVIEHFENLGFSILAEQEFGNIVVKVSWNEERLVQIDDHPTEDIYGDEILPGDTYYTFGEDVVLEMNLKAYVIDYKDAKYLKAGH